MSYNIDSNDLYYKSFTYIVYDHNDSAIVIYDRNDRDQWPVLQKVYDRKFTIVNYASVWSVSYDR
jgi:hypothetical protein